jgi:metal-dependent amidase/aminoacylase/carboxypeptidase family protein
MARGRLEAYHQNSPRHWPKPWAEAATWKCEKAIHSSKTTPNSRAATKAAAVSYMGAENVIDLDLWLAGEDFAFYSQVTDACFYRLGTRNEARGIISGVHTPTFDIDESALEIGPGLMAWLALEELKLS